MPRLAIYPGSFDPITNGHLSIIRRGLEVFDGLIVAVANNQAKTPLFNLEERLALMREAVQGDPRVEFDSFRGLLVEYAKRREVFVVLRGLRAVSDFEYEFQLANMNRKLEPRLDTLFMMTGEVATYGGDVSSMVPANVLQKLRERFPPGA
jgi:pantetheine-phosphate adenylyltransferase